MASAMRLFIESWHGVLAMLACCLALLVGAYWATAASTVALWSKDPLSHGFLVVPAAVYLAWAARHELASFKPAPVFWALPVLGLIAFVWFLGNLTDTTVIQQVCLVAMLIAFVWGMLGKGATRTLMFPLGFLLFALPLGDRLVPTLQDLTARFAVKMLSLTGVPVLLQGHVISIPGGSWLVAEACSGINYLMSSLVIGYLYAGLTYRYWSHRLGVVAAAALVPLVANGFRVYMTILIASLGGTRIVSGMEHYLFGWLVFAAMLALLFLVCGHWKEESIETRTMQAPGIGAPFAPNWRVVQFAALGLLLVGTAPLSAKLYRLPLEAEATIPRDGPEVSGPWGVAARDPYKWSPSFVEPKAEFLRTYDSGDHVVKLYVAYYSANQPDVKLASVTNVLFAEPWWASAERRVAVTVRGESFQARETVLQSPQSPLLVWSWYQVDGRSTGNDYVAKLLLAKARLFRSPRGSAAFAIATEEGPGIDAGANLKSFLDHLSFE
jgi:exosortase A